MKRRAEQACENDDRNINSTVKSSKSFKENEFLTSYFSNVRKIPKFKGDHGIHGKFIEGTYVIYPINNVKELIQSKFSAQKFSLGVVRLRFLLSEDFKLLYAPEGHPNPNIPHHYRMTGAKKKCDAVCTTAGNVFYNRQHEVVKVSHKSGDFHPDFDSLQWALAVMFVNNVKFAKKVIIEERKSSGAVLGSVSVDSDLLKEVVLNKFSARLKKIFFDNNQNLTKITHEYKDPNKKTTPLPLRPKIKPLNFDDLAPTLDIPQGVRESVMGDDSEEHNFVPRRFIL